MGQQPWGQQQFGGEPFPGQQYLNDPMANMAMQYGTSLAGQGKDIVHKNVSRYGRENLSSGCTAKPVLNQSPQQQRLARKLKFHL